MFPKLLNTLRKSVKSQLDSPESLDYEALPVMSGDELIRFLNQTNRVLSIKRKVMIDGVRFEKMYLQPIHRFCEIVQLAPASQAHHHSFAGGLIIHTLSVAEKAINERQKYTLPLSSEPHIIEAQKNLWTYAVFVAALCHDIGKIVTMVSFVDDKQQPIHVIGSSLLSQGIQTYQMAFKPTEYYQLHQRIGVSFLPQLLDSLSLNYLSAELDVFKEVLGYIQSDKYEWGSVGNIVQTADRESTAEALKITTDSRKFPGANIENFGERIMRTLRLVLNNSNIPKNRAGAAIWVSKNHTYAVAKPFAEMIREEMQKHGATDIPSDNTRIFDELQQQNFCETNPVDGQAIFRVEICLSDSKFQQTFTCLKIKNQRLYAADKVPSPLAGRIVEIMHESESETPMTESVTKPKRPKVKPQRVAESAPEETTATEPENPFTGADTGVDTGAESEETPITGAEITETSITDAGLNNDDMMDELLTGENVMESIAKTASQPKKASTVDREDHAAIVADFMDWLAEQVESKEYAVNRDSPLFVVQYAEKKHLAMMSPIIFAVYAHKKGFVKRIDSRSEIADAAKRIQKSLHNQKTNVGVAGKQVHLYRKKNSPSAKAPKLSFYLVPVTKISNSELRKLIEATELSNSIERQFAELKEN